MPGDRVADGVPGSSVPEVSGQLRGPVPAAQREPDSLAWRLTGVVDRVRGLSTKFGLRPHQVFLVHVRWTGKRRGEGSPQQVACREIVPRPRVRDMDSIRRVSHATGTIEEGDVVVDEISARIPEDDLMGRTPDLMDPTVPRSLAPNVEFFWLIVEVRPSSPRPARRRFAVAGVPALARDGDGWRVTLTKQDYDEGRDGGLGRDTP